MRFTKSELAWQFEQVGFRPNSLRGQCFLTDLNMLEAVVASAWLKPNDLVLEIGAGPGNLTTELARRAKLVLAVEVERLLFELAKDNLESFPNVRLIQADIMESKYTLSPVVEREVERALKGEGRGDFKVVSNLPYGVSTPAITALLNGVGARQSLPGLMILAVQKEVADRLTAPPGVKDYGQLTIAVQSVARVRRLRKMPPNVFWPRPKVESALIEIVPDERLRARVADPDLMQRLAAALFEHRRKTLANSLRDTEEFGQEWTRIEAALEECGIDPSLRGEALSVDEIISLANVLARE